jgi:hypothetical protein
VTAKNKEGKLGGNFNRYSFDQQLFKEPIHLSKWAQELYSKFTFLDVGNGKMDKDDASVLSKHPTGRMKVQAQAWAQDKRDLYLKSSSTTGRSITNSANNNSTSDNNNSTHDNNGDRGGGPKKIVFS